jgi:DNA-binding IclR family transcriptional regulator
MPDQFPSGSDRRDSRSREEQLATVIREFDELGGLALTPAQAARLFGLQPDRCERLLGELVDGGFLRRRDDGQYARDAGDGAP